MLFCLSFLSRGVLGSWRLANVWPVLCREGLALIKFNDLALGCKMGIIVAMRPLAITSWNVNGIRSIAGKTLPDFLQTKNPDIVCFQEIKANTDQAEALALPYPYRFWHPAERAGYSGTGVVSKIKPLDVIVDFPDSAVQARHPKEGRILTLEFDAFFLVNVYVPNAKSDLSRLAYRAEVWGPDFRNLLADFARKKPVLTCGDFNVAHQPIDLARPNENRMSAGFTDEERADFSRTLDAGFVDLLREEHPDEAALYSWWSYRGGARARNVGWRIDYFLSSPSLRSAVDTHTLLPNVLGSDHCPVALSLKL